ncbi:hypothetical protein BX265_6174 [Streptomyces sp. TLI_235]|nr:DUF6221 family protein [Streptomyces sp. TLI_235]PBC71564.1 hypothetical protein BX265_6174 [Streptomyces sp. TLI_235]
MTDDLVAFLNARLDDTARKAQAATRDGAARWHTEPDREYDGYAVADEHGEPVVYNEGSPTIAQAAHIAEHDPELVLAEVDAKRRIIAEHPWRQEPDWPSGRQCTQCATEHPCQTLRLLTLPYSNHPDYGPEWAPGH